MPEVRPSAGKLRLLSARSGCEPDQIFDQVITADRKHDRWGRVCWVCAVRPRQDHKPSAVQNHEDGAKLLADYGVLRVVARGVCRSLSIGRVGLATTTRPPEKGLAGC